MAEANISVADVTSSATPLKFEFVQNSFRGGMNLMDDETKVGEDEYREAFNILNRENKLTPINKPEEIGIEAPYKKQGIYAVGQYTFLFAGGNAYYKKFSDLRFQQVDGFKMSEGVERIYICAVPVSNANLQRNLLKQVDNGNNNINTNLDTIFVNQVISSSPQCILCQDGLNQPFIIFYDSISNTLKCRVTQKYEEWGLERNKFLREYVPIGLDMLYSGDGILYVISPDRTKIYPSVTGRPLDFVINVTATGDKGGDADTTFYSVGYAKIVSIFTASGYDGFIVSTENNNTFGILPDYNSTLFGEPTYSKETLFATSALNSFCVIDILGDTAFIDAEGVKSFNGAKQQKTESGNTIFSLKVASLFKNVIQDFTNCAAIVYNGYALFGVKTTFGNVILIYDTDTQVWVSMIRADNITGNIKQFISMKPYANRLYCITSDDKMFEIFAPDSTTSTKLDGEIYTQAFIANSLKIEQECEDARVIIKSQDVDGEVTVELLVDTESVSTDSLLLRKQDKIHNIPFIFTTPFIGWQVQYRFTWSGGGELTHIMHTSSLHVAQQSFNQMKQV